MKPNTSNKDRCDLEIVLGQRRTGKTTYMVALAKRNPPSIIFDPVLGTRGMEEGAEIRGSCAAARAAIGDKAVILRTEEPVNVVLALFEEASPKLPNGLYCAFDEGVLLATSADATKIKSRIRQFAAFGRHKKISLILTAQAANLVDYQLLALSDRLTLFRTTDKYNLDKLRNSGVPEDIVNDLPRLPDFEFYQGVPSRDDDWECLCL